MELIAWHYTWDNRFLARLSHHPILRVGCWLPSVIAGIVTLYCVWQSGLAKFGKEKEQFLKDESEGITAGCAIVQNEDSLAKVNFAYVDLNRKMNNLEVRIIGVTVLSLVLFINSLVQEI